MQLEMKINRRRMETFFLISSGQNTVVYFHFAAHSPACQFLFAEASEKVLRGADDDGNGQREVTQREK